MTGQKLIFFIIEWLIVAHGARAFMSGCINGFCFLSSPPSANTLSSDSAQQWCSRNGSRLIEITNKDIQNALSSFLNSISSTYSYTNSLFTNGKRNSGSWTWVTRNTASGLFVGGANDATYAYAYLQLTTTVAVTVNASQNASSFTQFTVTASRPTDTKQGYICEDEFQCTNTAGFLLNNRCYKSYSNESLSWYDARNRCLDRGGDLASFEFIGSNQGLNVLNGSWISPSTPYWIDLRREFWTWRDSQTDMKYSNWLSGYPITYSTDPFDCLCLHTNSWSWTVCRCQETRPFICLTDVRISTQTTTNATSTSTSASTATTTSTVSTESGSHYSTADSSTKTTDNKAISSMTSRATSGGNELPLPTVPTTVTSRSNPCLYESADKPRISVEVGVAIGLGIGIPLIIVIAVLAVVIAILRKQLRRAHLSLETYKRQQPVNGDMHELNDKTGNPYESLQPITESTSGLYQSLDPSTKTDNVVVSSNI